jgi:Na+/H+-dicarboxylate symporter
MRKFSRPATAYCLAALLTGLLVGSVCVGHAGSEAKAGLLTSGSLLFQLIIRLATLLLTLYLLMAVTILFYTIQKEKRLTRPGNFFFFFFMALFLFAASFFDLEHLFYPSFAWPVGSQLTPLFILESLVPKSLFDALAHNNGLQVFVFSVFFGCAAGSLKAKPLIEGIIRLKIIIIKMTLRLRYPFIVLLFLVPFLCLLKFA